LDIITVLIIKSYLTITITTTVTIKTMTKPPIAARITGKSGNSVNKCHRFILVTIFRQL